MTGVETAQVIVTSVGAFGTLVAASAAVYTARQANTTATKAAEAYARTAQPDVTAIVETDDNSFITEPTTTFRIKVKNNDTRFAAKKIAVRGMRPGDGPQPTVKLSRSGVLFPGSTFNVGTLSLVDPLLGAAELPHGLFELVVRFSDASELVTWERYVGVVQMFREGPDATQVSYNFVIDLRDAVEVEPDEELPSDVLTGLHRFRD